jgi:hypothetical protein
VKRATATLPSIFNGRNNVIHGNAVNKNFNGIGIQSSSNTAERNSIDRARIGA